MKTIVAVQCRLSSSRLPGKALLPLGGKTVLDWTLASMKKVPAEEYYVATDEDSYEALKPICERNGFEVFKGPLEDVLERYCLLIQKTGADVVIRATADNPFLFYEAASSLVEQYKRRNETSKCDYITYQNLPHGSGVEMFDAHSLLRARELTQDPYDHEHVGPSLYNHPENFNSVMIPSPAEWSYPKLRTTIDTRADYRRALAIVKKISGNDFSEENPVKEPYTSQQILSVFEDPLIENPILCVPCVKKGKGTGHLRRCLSIALDTGADVYIPDDAGLAEIDELLTEARENGLCDTQLVNQLPEKGDYAMIITDAFTLERDFALKLAERAPLAAIDEGSLNGDLCDCLVDIIPSYGLARPANITEPSFVTLPKNVRKEPKLSKFSDIKTILVTVGGEDPADLVVPTVNAIIEECGKRNIKVTAISNDENASSRIPENYRNLVEFTPPVHNLREQLFKYDVVITHYGFTAFEALAAGCAVLLLGTTPLHVQLAQKYNFACMSANSINTSTALSLLENIDSLYPDSPVASKNGERKGLGEFVKVLSQGRRFSCPVCQNNHPSFVDPIVSRTTLHTFRRCHNCGMLYMAWTINGEDTNYNEDYFFADYKKQYGKTYLDDFKHIKSQCVRRTSIVDYIYRGQHKAVTPTVLDIGCAFGPYLDAANDAGWQVFGTDASQEAVDYVQNTLHYPASCAKFPAFDPVAEFGVKSFDAVTMWYVIEHFQNLDAVLRNVSKILKTGGVFAFSTPSASGVSGRFNTQSFFQNSPADHYTLWEPGRAASILKKYGFKVVKVVSTGHHPERFPRLQGKVKPTSLTYALYSGASHFFGLGDTFEVYCKKEKDIFN
ncbi:MAG: methyltransferase domain-containing protein [Treponema sp.]|nr:methyltransferase domain-containing protein [Candidatus Treponema equifaecale]